MALIGDSNVLWAPEPVDPSDVLASSVSTTGDPIVDQARRRFKRAQNWESNWRGKFIEDIKFRHGDSDNGYMWPSVMRQRRDVDRRPCLTMNLIRQHNLMIVNQGLQAPTQMVVKPMGNGATAEAATMWNNLIDRIQYNSSAQQNVYAPAREFQVDGGCGYWRLMTDYVSNDSFDVDIWLQCVNDPLMIYTDPDARKRDGSDMKWAFNFDDVPREEWREAYPEFGDYAGDAPFMLGEGDAGDWVSKEHVRLAEYFRKVTKRDKLLNFVDKTTGERKTVFASMLPDAIRSAVEDDKRTKTRDSYREQVQWYLILGNKVVDSTVWPGKYIPIIRCVGEETVIEGVMDRKGHTRAMKDAQRMFNYNASGQVEYVALQSKVPYTGAADAIQEFEDYWNSANSENHSFLPFNHLDARGNPLPPQALPQRQNPPTAAPAYESGMNTAFQQIMMVSGQWQNQMGMAGNERTGSAIQERQQQSDTATFHYQANFDAAVTFCCKQMLDLIPKVYDTRRILSMQGQDGQDFELMLDPGAQQAYQERRLHDGTVIQRILNPQIGQYDVKAAVGDGNGTMREKTVQALTLLLTQAPALTGIIGDLLLRSMDFKEAQEAAQRLRRMVPPQALGEGPSQQAQQLQQQVQQLQVALAKALGTGAADRLKLLGKEQMRDIDIYKAETDRFKALGDALMLDQGGIEQVIQQLIQESLGSSLQPIIDANAGDLKDETQGGNNGPSSSQTGASAGPPMPGAQQAGDGEWYLRDPTKSRGFLRLAPLAQEHKTDGVLG